MSKKSKKRVQRVENVFFLFLFSHMMFCSFSFFFFFFTKRLIMFGGLICLFNFGLFGLLIITLCCKLRYL